MDKEKNMRINKLLFKNNKIKYWKSIIIFPLCMAFMKISLIYFYSYLVSLNNYKSITLLSILFLLIFTFVYFMNTYLDLSFTTDNEFFFKRILVDTIINGSDDTLTFNKGEITEVYKKISDLSNFPKIYFSVIVSTIEIITLVLSIWYFFGLKVLISNLIIVPVFLLFNRQINKLISRNKEVIESNALSNNFSQEVILNLEVIKSFNVKDNVMQKLLKLNKNFVNKTSLYRTSDSFLIIVSRFLYVMVACLSMISVILFTKQDSMIISASFISAALAQSVVELFDSLKNKRNTMRILEKYSLLNFLINDSRVRRIEKNFLNDHVIISTKNLSYKYSNSENPIVEDKNLNFINNELYTIIGESGAGKTTLLKCLAGLLQNYEGQIQYSTDNIIYVSQFPVFLQLSIKENILIGSDNKEIDFFNNTVLEEYLNYDVSINSVSGGQLQIINILRALNSYPDILILDEPFSSLHEELRAELFSVLEEYAKSHLVIMATHDRDIILKSKNKMIISSNVSGCSM